MLSGSCLGQTRLFKRGQTTTYGQQYLEVKVTGKDLVDLVNQSNKIFVDLERRKIIQEKEKNYFKFNFKKETNVRKAYLLLKIDKNFK